MISFLRKCRQCLGWFATIPPKPVSSSSKSQKPKEVSLKQSIRARCSNHLSAWNWWLKWDSCHLVLVTYLSSCCLIDFVEVWIMPSCSANEVNITIHIWIRYMLPALLLSSWFKRNLSGCGSKKHHTGLAKKDPKKTINKKLWKKYPLQGTILNYIS